METDNHYAGTGAVISNFIDIEFIHAGILGPSLEKKKTNWVQRKYAYII